MKTEIEIWNGDGWNNYAALRTIKSIKVGSRGLAAKQGIVKIEVSPANSEKPFGIAARYFDAEGEEVFCQGFDQNDSAEYIKERIYALLLEGIENRKIANLKKSSRAAYVEKISAWRRNFEAKRTISNSVEKLSQKFHAMRRKSHISYRPSRRLCTTLAGRVTNGGCTYVEAVSQIAATGGIQK